MEEDNDDVFFQDDDVCILYPHVKRGILVFSRFTNPAVFKDGLFSGAELKRRNPNYGERSVYHDVIFFRAPFRYGDEGLLPLEAYYEDDVVNNFTAGGEDHLFVIRIDPDKTYVYSSEARVHDYSGKQSLLRASRKSLNQYIDVIDQNKLMLPPSPSGWIAEYNIVSGRKRYITMRQYKNTHGMLQMSTNYNNYTPAPIQRNSEFLVHLPVIPASIAVEII
jgi:hypothetical protein